MQKKHQAIVTYARAHTCVCVCVCVCVRARARVCMCVRVRAGERERVSRVSRKSEYPVSIQRIKNITREYQEREKVSKESIKREYQERVARERVSRVSRERVREYQASIKSSTPTHTYLSQSVCESECVRESERERVSGESTLSEVPVC